MSKEINFKESYSFCSFVFVFSIVFSQAFLFAKGEGSGIFFSGRDGCLELKQEQSLSHSKALHRTCFSYITCHSLSMISNFRTYFNRLLCLLNVRIINLFSHFNIKIYQVIKIHNSSTYRVRYSICKGDLLIQ